MMAFVSKSRQIPDCLRPEVYKQRHIAGLHGSQKSHYRRDLVVRAGHGEGQKHSPTKFDGRLANELQG
jgi:hypothetical protein